MIYKGFLKEFIEGFVRKVVKKTFIMVFIDKRGLYKWFLLIKRETLFQISGSSGKYLFVGRIIRIPPGFRFIMFIRTSSVSSVSLTKASFRAIISKNE